MDADDPLKVLFLSANPPGREGRTLAPEREAQILAARFAAQQPQRLTLAAHHGVTNDALLGLVLAHRPAILHFSGHGSDRGLVMLDRAAQATPVSGPALAELVAAVGGVRCVVLNACFARLVAMALLPRTGFVIGIDGVAKDDTAIAYAVGLYSALAAGESVASAVRFGRLQALLEARPDFRQLSLYHRPDVDPRAITLVPRPSPQGAACAAKSAA